jgi:hypothetical protein
MFLKSRKYKVNEQKTRYIEMLLDVTNMRYMPLLIQKIFRGLYPRIPVEQGMEQNVEEREGMGGSKGRRGAGKSEREGRNG